MADTPAGFSSPMTGGTGKKASAAAAAALNELKNSAKQYADNMERGAKAAERAAHAQAKSGGGGHYIGTLLGQGGPAGGSSAIGGGARMPDFATTKARDTALRATMAGPPAGFPGARTNGGGANIPASPGSGGTPGASYDETRARDAALREEVGAAPRQNGGGASFGGSFRKASPMPNAGAPTGMTGAASSLGRGLGTAFGAAIAAPIAATGTYKDYDWIANRMAVNTAGGYNKRAAAQNINRYFGGGFANAAELRAQTDALNAGGFTVGSSGYATQASSIRSIATLNPTLAGQAGQIATGFQRPEMVNRMRMFGVETMGEGGRPLSVNQIARNLYSRSAGAAGVDPSKAPSVANVAAYFGPGGSLERTASMNGWSQEQTSAVRDSLMASAQQGRFITDKDAQSRNRDKNPFADTMMGGDQSREKGNAELITSHLENFANGYIKGQETIGGALTKLADAINALPDGIRDVFAGTAGFGAAMTHGGGGVGNSVFGGIAGGIAGAGSHLLGPLARGGWKAAKGAPGLARRVFGAASPSRVAGAARAGSRFGKAVPILGEVLMAADAALGVKYGATDDSEDYRDALVRKRGHGEGRGDWNIKLAAAEHHALGWIPGVNKWLEHGDGPGGKHGSSYFPGVQGAGFRGQQWGDGPGSESAQAEAAKTRGGETVSILEELLKGYKGSAQVTSSVRHGKSGVTVSGNVSYHATGNAIDIAANSPGKDTPELLAINKYFAQYGAGLNELIYAGPGGTLVKDGKQVGRGYYGKDVMDIHHNHVHVAATAGMLKNLKGKSKQGFLGKVAGAVSGAVHRVLGKGKAAVHRAAAGAASLAGRMGAAVTRGGYSQAAMLDQLLHGLGPSFGSIGSHTTTVDPTEAASDAAASKTGSNKVTSMPAGSARENALTIIKVAKEMGISKRGAIIGIATAEQESGLINLHSGDRDSQGLFQQRPSQGWGSVAEVTNPEHAARSFFERLRGLDYNHLPVTEAAQKVQRSAYPDAYAKWEGIATGIVDQSHVYGDGPGRAGASAATVTADVPTPAAHMARGGSGNMTVHSRGGSSISIAKVEVHITSPQVSPTEARRIGKMVVDEIAQQARMKEMSR